MKSIQAKEQSVDDVFRNQFIIPDFQRPYSWTELQCAQLLSDLTSAFHESLVDSSQEQKYFLGNIIYYPDKSGEKVWNIVDGQQRLTTLLMLMRALYENTRTRKEHKALKKKVYNVDPLTDEAIEGDVRLKSLVPPGDKEYNFGDLKKVLARDFSKMSKKNPFKLNYERLENDLDEWWSKNEDKWEAFIKYLNEKVVLLPIQCESEWDALDLFEIINDRGVALDDADIFKARIYKSVDPKEREEFVQRWNDLSDHLELFRIYMYILKAENTPDGTFSSKRGELRKYIVDECLKNKKRPLKTGWKTLMDSLEKCHFYKTHMGQWVDDADFSNKESIYWTILEQHPTKEYWKYPLFVFIHKYAKFREDSLVMSPNKRKEYIELLKETVKFFFTKGVVRNSIDAVRGTALKVCVQIEQDNTFLSTYKKEIKGELGELGIRLSDSNYGKSYNKGLVFLNSFLNPNQKNDLYAEKIRGKIHIEHILPKNWAHYDKWTKDSHDENRDKIGNLIPLEQKINIRAANEFFARKQNEYKSSDIQDALDLIERPAYWYPKDLKKRHEEAVLKLMAFFSS